MQQQPNNLNSPVVEVALIAIAGVLIVIGAVLLYLGKIDVGFASFIFMTAFSAAFGLLGINLAYKAPSPGQVAQQNAQQVQQNAQLQNVSNLLSQALTVLPMFANLLHSHAPVNVTPPPQQTPTMTSMAGTAPTAMVRQLVQQPPVVQQVPVQQSVPLAQQFKPPVFAPLPDISMPMAAMPAQQPPAQP